MIRRLRGDLADLLVGIHRVFAYFEHIAQNRHFALAGQGLEGLERRTHGQGARVITVVDDIGVFHSGHQFHPPVSGLIGAERFGDLDQVQSENDADAGGRGGCVGVGFSEHAVDAHRHVAAPVFQLEGHSHRTLALRAVLQVRDAHVRALVETEGQHVRAGPVGQGAHPLLVVIQNGVARRGQAFNEPGLFPGHFLRTGIELHVHRHVPHRGYDA